MNTELEQLRAELSKTKTELNKVKSEYVLQNNLLIEILEGSLAGYWDYNFVTEKGIMSPRFKEMFGYKDSEIPNNDFSIWTKLIHPDDLLAAEALLVEHIKSKGKISYVNEVRYTHKDGSIVWVYCKGAVIEWTENNEPIRFVGCHVDITPLKNALQVVGEQQKELLIKNKDLEQFAYIVSHDLKEPLRTISSFIEIYNREFAAEIKNDKAKYYLNLIENSSERMSSLIDALLDYTKIGWYPQLQKTDLNLLVENVIDDLRLLIHDTNTKFKIDKLPTLNVYPTELRTLFQNLISNAIKFSKVNEPAYFQVSAIKKDNEWEFDFKDNGIGIAKEHFERIFIIFKRLHKVREVEGVGVGLAHCKRIIDLHKGNIWVESEENIGSSFKFTIPIK